MIYRYRKITILSLLLAGKAFLLDLFIHSLKFAKQKTQSTALSGKKIAAPDKDTGTPRFTGCSEETVRIISSDCPILLALSGLRCKPTESTRLNYLRFINNKSARGQVI